MKQKLLFISLLLVCSCSVFAGGSLSHENWRWRNDDGNETTATFKAAQNTAFTLANNQTIRLRVRIENKSATDNSNNHGIKYMSYATDPKNGPFTEITANGTANAFTYASSSFVSDGDATSVDTYLTTVNSNNLTPYTYQQGLYFSTVHSTATIFPAKSTYSDFEFVIKLTANAIAGTTYYFKLNEGDTKTGTDPNQTALPHLTTAATITLPVSFVSFDLANEGNGVKLSWSTASEQNNDHFEISRSSDGVNWVKLAPVAGIGNSTAKNVYNSKDDNPANGVNYYRLTQYDKNGTSTVLSTKIINVAISSSTLQVSVYPNPTVSDLSFVLSGLNKNQSIKATLIDLSGRTVYSEAFENATNGVTYKVDLFKKPVAGVYILKIQGETTLLNKRVVFK